MSELKKCFMTSLFIGSHFRKHDMPVKFQTIPGFDYILVTNINKKRFNTSWKVLNITINGYTKSITTSRYPKFQGWKLLKKELGIEYDIIIYCDAFLSPKPDFDWNKIHLELDLSNKKYVGKDIEKQIKFMQSYHEYDKAYNFQ